MGGATGVVAAPACSCLPMTHYRRFRLALSLRPLPSLPHAFDLRFGRRRWTLRLVKLRPNIVELVAGLVVRHVVGRLGQMLEVAAALLQHLAQRMKYFTDLAGGILRFHPVQA